MATTLDYVLAELRTRTGVIWGSFAGDPNANPTPQTIGAPVQSSWLVDTSATPPAIWLKGSDGVWISVSPALQEMLATATAQAVIATTKAGEAAGSATAAATSKTGAETAQTAAELARDAAQADANVYASTAAGLAAVADGVQFMVVVGSEIVRYVRTNSTTATEVARYPAAAAVDALESVISEQVPLSDTDYAFVVRDSATKQTPFAVLADVKGTIINPHIAEIEATANDAALSRQTATPSADAVAWGVGQLNSAGQRALLLGVRDRDGMILNPTFQAVWDAVFGSGGGTGDLAETDTVMLHGPRIYAVEGRSIDLFGSAMLPNRNSGYGYIFGLQSVNAGNVPLHSLFREHLRVRADDLGATARLKIINEGILATEFSKALTVVKSAAAKAATPRVALIGDSLTAGSYLRVADRFAGYTVTPTFMGSRRSDAGRPVWCEGRGGWGAIDYCYDRTDYTPLPAGQEATAIASGLDNRNPFIRVATGGDNPAHIRNGYIFDYRYYLDRFSFADPDIVVINLGTNDINNLDWPTGFPKARDCIDIMVEQIQAAVPGVIIGLAQSNKGNNSYFNPRWYNGWAPLFLHHHATYGASSDVHVLSSHASMLDRLALPTTTSATNAQTGQTKQVMSDGTHPDTFIGYESYAESIFSFIHAVA